MTELEKEAARLFAGRMTRVRVRKELLERGLSEQEVGRVLDAGWQISERRRRLRMLFFRLVGSVLLVGGAGANIYTWFFISEDFGFIFYPLLVVPLAGLVVIIAPDTLESVGDWFSLWIPRR